MMLDPPASKFAVLTKHDTNDIPLVNNKGPRALYIGGTGNITVLDQDGVSCLISTIPAGSILPIRPTRLMSTGTTATTIVALY